MAGRRSGPAGLAADAGSAAATVTTTTTSTTTTGIVNRFPPRRAPRGGGRCHCLLWAPHGP